jgi:hypothetical protein
MREKTKAFKLTQREAWLVLCALVAASSSKRDAASDDALPTSTRENLNRLAEEQETLANKFKVYP